MVMVFKALYSVHTLTFKCELISGAHLNNINYVLYYSSATWNRIMLINFKQTHQCTYDCIIS
jgi:hypothetical protein